MAASPTRARATLPRDFPHGDGFLQAFERFDEVLQEDIRRAAEKAQFVLNESQWRLVLNELALLSTESFVVNTSQTGAGKTYMCAFLALVFEQVAMRLGKEFQLFIVAPVGAQGPWMEVLELAGLYPYFMESPEGLATLPPAVGRPKASGMEAVLGHRYLTCYLLKRAKGANSNDKMGFRPTKAWADMCMNNVCFVVADECQKLKNDSNMNHAFAAFVAPIMRWGGHYSRCCLASATPYDAEGAFLSFFRVIGAYVSNELYTNIVPRDPEAAIESGMSEIRSFCAGVDPRVLDDTDDFQWKDVRYGRSTEAIKHMFLNAIVKNYFAGENAQIRPELLQSYNGYYKMAPEVLRRIRDQIDELRHLMRGDPEKNDSKANMGEFQRRLQEIQRLKLPTFERLGVAVLEENPRAKLVIAVKHLDHMEQLRQYFSAFGPVLCVNGDLGAKERHAAARHFREPNNNFRVFIFTYGAGAVSLSLHDTEGNFPRTMYMMPDFNMTQMVQAAGRVFRTGLKSLVRVFTVYAKDEEVAPETAEEERRVTREIPTAEVRILIRLRQRSEIARTALQNNKEDEDTGTGVQFPGEFENYEEP